MANWCDFEIHIKGTKENCYKFKNKMMDTQENNNDYYNEPNHFFRMFECNITNEEGTDNEYIMWFNGHCAWSLYICCIESSYTPIDLFAKNTLDLNLKLEAYSSEEGIGFMEHYIYENGKCLKDEECEAFSYYWDRQLYPTYEEWIEKEHDGDSTKIPPEEDFDESGNATFGGFDWYFEF